MPIGLHYSSLELEQAIANSSELILQIDESVTRILTAMISLGMFEVDYYNGDENPLNNVTSEEHNALAREIAGKSSVLLKNKNDLLPLKLTSSDGSVLLKRIVVIGNNDTISGGGSGSVTPSYIVTHALGIQNIIDEMNVNNNYNIEVIYNDGSDISAAVDLASDEETDLVVVVVATTSSEASDRDTLSLGQHQDDLVASIANSSSVQSKCNMIVSVITPGASLLPWHDDVSILYKYLYVYLYCN